MRTLFALLLTGACGVFAIGQGQSAKQPFAIVISAVESTVKARSSVPIRVQMTNTSSQDLDASGNWSDLTGADPNYVFDVRDSAGKLAPKRVYEHPELQFGKAIFRTVGPGGSITDTPDISRQYDLSRPGKYVIQVARRVPDNPKDGVVKSNKITVTVVP
jgi:hypothetical protein